MKFREWFVLQEISDGLKRQFYQQYPHLPKYVADQILQNRVGPLWNNTLAGKQPTMAPMDARPQAIQQSAPQATAALGSNGRNFFDDPTGGTKPPVAKQPAPKTFNHKYPTYSRPGQIFSDPYVSRIADNDDWELKVIEIGPLDFTQNTLRQFLRNEFGSSPSQHKTIYAHAQRMQVQNKLAGERGESNEPIILVKYGNKYELEEGWHRIYSYLLNYSAPPEELAKIQNHQIDTIDLSLWKPVRIQAYVGSLSAAKAAPMRSTVPMPTAGPVASTSAGVPSLSH